MKSLLAAALFLFPLSLRAQDSLVGEWKIDPSQLAQVHKTIEPIIANVVAKTEDAAEKQKIREHLTKIFLNHRFTFTKTATGAWEQETEFDGKTGKLPVTITKVGKGETYHIHRGGKHTFILSIFDADHLTLTSASEHITFPMIRDKGEAAKPTPPATPAETPEP